MSKDRPSVCSVCSTWGTLKICSLCKQGFYCSRDCQRRDWETHRLKCLKYQVEVLKYENMTLVGSIARLKQELKNAEIRRYTQPCFLKELKDAKAASMVTWMYCEKGDCLEQDAGDKKHPGHSPQECVLVACSSGMAEAMEQWHQGGSRFYDDYDFFTLAHEIYQLNQDSHKVRRIHRNLCRNLSLEALSKKSYWSFCLESNDDALAFTFNQFFSSLRSVFERWGMKIAKIFKNRKPVNFEAFNAYCRTSIERKDCRFIIGYHGTGQANLQQILKNHLMIHYSEIGT